MTSPTLNSSCKPELEVLFHHRSEKIYHYRCDLALLLFDDSSPMSPTRTNKDCGKRKYEPKALYNASDSIVLVNNQKKVFALHETLASGTST